MLFTVYFPPQTSKGKVPVVYYLSGLSCTDENFIQKGLNIEGEDESWDFGSSAGFYLNATQPKWKNYRMYEYITEELPATLQHLPELDTQKASIMGHSMGGHGALTIGIKNPAKFKSISAFAPICNPSQVPWGKKAFSGYLGHDQSQWKQYDAVELLGSYSGPQLEVMQVLVDIGTDDNFLKEQLDPEALRSAAQGKLKLELRMQEGYDHSYFTISTFVDSHIALHAKHLTS
eukprot:jgi/Astpho2/8964/Aster-02642